MTFTAVHNGEPHGFVLLRGTLMDGGGSGEAHVQAPDGSIVLLQWTNPDDIHFQLLPSTDGKYVDTSWNVDEEETLLDLFPDLRRTRDGLQKLDHEPVYDSLPDLEQQREAWKAGQGE